MRHHVAIHVGQAHVEEDPLGGEMIESGQCRGAVAGYTDFMSFHEQHIAQRLGAIDIVVHHQHASAAHAAPVSLRDGRRVLRPAARGSVMRNSLPRFSPSLRAST